jgi:hypothetical protein
MGQLEKIERQIMNLSRKKMAELREWFAAFDAEAWDRQFEITTHPVPASAGFLFVPAVYARDPGADDLPVPRHRQARNGRRRRYVMAGCAGGIAAGLSFLLFDKAHTRG